MKPQAVADTIKGRGSFLKPEKKWLFLSFSVHFNLKINLVGRE